MNLDRLRELFEQVQRGDLSVAAALEAMRALPYRDIGIATVDHHRAVRQGCPEVIYGEGKSPDQIVAIARDLSAAGHNVLVTRLSPDQAEALRSALPDLRYHPTGRIAELVQAPAPARPVEPVVVVTAGTSDLAVAEEALVTLHTLGIPTAQLFDVGVAGIHRLFDRLALLQRASAVIVIAGMEGALASVVGGVVACPLVAVPTSTGYGTALGGFTALLAMLTCCAAGVTVVNIDNGFGAAMAIHRILPPR